MNQIAHRRAWPGSLVAIALSLCALAAAGAAEAEPEKHPANGTAFRPTDVDRARPVYRTEFGDPAELRDWVLEGGESMKIESGKLVLESAPNADPSKRSVNHLVCWLKQEIPADFLLEFTVRPQDKQTGLNIVFFSTRGTGGQSIFDPALAKRNGSFPLYHSGDLDGYHVSYWAPPRPSTHIRKNKGFHLVAASDLDVIASAPPETFETVKIYKRGAMIRVLVGDQILVAWDDDGRKYGPAHLHPGWIGLRQMGYTLKCEYDSLAVYPLMPGAGRRGK
ncbi:MAG: DUF1961 family protein [Opitutaceae bacterium]